MFKNGGSDGGGRNRQGCRLSRFHMVSITTADGFRMVFDGQCHRFIFRLTSFVATFSSVKGQWRWQMQPCILEWTNPSRKTGPSTARSLFFFFFTASCLLSFLFFIMLSSSSFSTFRALVKASSTLGIAALGGRSIVVRGEMGFPEVHHTTLSSPHCVPNGGIKEQKESHDGHKIFEFTGVKSHVLGRHDGLECRG